MVAIATVPKKHIHCQVTLELEQIFLVLPESIPKGVDMDVERFTFRDGRGIAPHVLPVRWGLGSLTVASSMEHCWDNAETTCDFVEVRDVSENAKARTIGEVIDCPFLVCARHQVSPSISLALYYIHGGVPTFWNEVDV